MKYFTAVFLFLIMYLLVTAFCSLIINAVLFGKMIVVFGYSPDWHTWIANILGIVAGIYSAKAVLKSKPRRSKTVHKEVN